MTQLYRHETGRIFSMGLEKPKHVCEAYRDVAAVHDLPTILQAIKDGRNSLSKWCYTILNQTSHPWCWSFSGTQTLMVLLNQLFGDKTILDPSMGPAITGVTGGNSIDALLLEVQAVYGQFPAALLKDDPVAGTTNIRMKTWPATWKDEAAKRIATVDSVMRCHSELALASALITTGPDDPNRPCTVGVDWQGGGHALSCLEVGSDDGKTLFFAGPNSWSTDFDSGWGSYPGRPGWWKLKAIQMGEAFSSDGFGSYCLMAAKDAVAPTPPTPVVPPKPDWPVPPQPWPPVTGEQPCPQDTQLEYLRRKYSAPVAGPARSAMTDVSEAAQAVKAAADAARAAYGKLASYEDRFQAWLDGLYPKAASILAAAQAIDAEKAKRERFDPTKD